MSSWSKARYKGKAKGKPSGKGTNFSQKTRDHAGENLHEDLRKQGANMRRRNGSTPAEIEIIKGVARASYIPALNRLGTDAELDDALKTVSTLAARTYKKPRADRPEPKMDGTMAVTEHVPKNANEYFHSNLPPGIVLALRWGSPDFLNLANPTPALDANLRYVAALVMSEYGVIVVASIRHAPSAYTDGRFDDLGWLMSDKKDPDRDEKFGGWNLHNQVYITRVANGVYHCKHRSFSYVGDVLISSYWLKEYGVDIHAVARATKIFNLNRSYTFEGGKLPIIYERLIASKKVSRETAIARVVDGKMKVWDANWAMSKGCKNAQDRLDFLVADKSEIQEPIDLFVSIKSAEDIERRLVALDPCYGPLLAKGRKVYAQLKDQHAACGYSRSLNSLLTEYEDTEAAAAAEKLRKEKLEQEAAAKEEAARKEKEMAALRAQNNRLVDVIVTKSGREQELWEASERQRDEINKLEAGYSELSEAAAREVAGYEYEILGLKAEQAALIEAVQEAKAERVLYAPEVLKAALRAAAALIQAGKDLSSLPKEFQMLVEIQPEIRTKMVKAQLHGRVVSIPALGPAGQLLEETNPIAGQVGLSLSIRRYVEASITRLQQAAIQDNGVSKAVLLNGYKEVLAVHNELLAVEKLDFQQLEDAVERRINKAPTSPNDRYCMKPKYLAIAREAAESGDITAKLYLEECGSFSRSEVANDTEPSPGLEIIK